jgi:peptide/nickel transport system permease protein
MGFGGVLTQVDHNQGETADLSVSCSYWQRLWLDFWRHTSARAWVCFFLSFFVLGLLAPLLANDKPLVWKYDDQWYAPAIADLWALSVADERSFYERLRDEGSLDPKKEQFRLMPLWRHGPYEIHSDQSLRPPSCSNPMGTDIDGRDVLTRWLYGMRIAFFVGLGATMLTAMLGLVLGLVAGFFGGKTEFWIMRLVEIMSCFPVLFLVLTLLAVFGPSLWHLVWIIGLTGWTEVTRLVRGEVLRQKSQSYFEGAMIVGVPPLRLMLGYLLPAIVPILITPLTFMMAGSILLESGLSFLGFGVPAPAASWGEILAQGRLYLDLAWWLLWFPGLSLFIVLAGLDRLGQYWRDSQQRG